MLDLAEALKARRKEIPQKSDDAFRGAFVEELYRCWLRLTGKIPGKAADTFIKFVAAAHATVGRAGPTDLGLPFHVERWDTDRERERELKMAIRARKFERP